MNIPFHIQILSKLIPILKLSGVKNLSKGEIEKFNYIDSQKGKHNFNDQVIGSKDGFDFIWRHISNDWFKVVLKTLEN